MRNRCIFSPCRQYRYVLVHDMEAGLFTGRRRRIAWIGLNPSTADEAQLDPTLRRIRGFTETWGFTGFVMLNLFAFRATEPADMKRHAEPVGADNDRHLLAATAECEFVVCCWGNHGAHLKRASAVLQLLGERDLRCLKITGKHQPEHPLYLPANLRPARYP